MSPEVSRGDVVIPESQKLNRENIVNCNQCYEEVCLCDILSDIGFFGEDYSPDKSGCECFRIVDGEIENDGFYYPLEKELGFYFDNFDQNPNYVPNNHSRVRDGEVYANWENKLDKEEIISIIICIRSVNVFIDLCGVQVVDLQSHRIPYNQACVHFTCGEYVKLDKVISVIIHSTVYDDIDLGSWKICKLQKRRSAAPSEISSRLEYKLQRASIQWRENFFSSVKMVCGININLTIAVDGKSRTVQRNKDRQIKATRYEDVELQSKKSIMFNVDICSLSDFISFMNMNIYDYGSRHYAGQMILQNDVDSPYTTLGLSLDIASIVLTHSRFTKIEGELSGFLDNMLIIIETLKCVRNAESSVSVYSSLCACARLMGFKVQYFLDMCGFSLGGSSDRKTLRFGRPEVGTEYSIPKEDFIISGDLEGETSESIIDIGGGIFISEDDKPELILQTFSDLPKSMHSSGFKILNSIFGAGIAVGLYKVFGNIFEPHVLLNVTRDSIKLQFSNIIDILSGVMKAFYDLDFWKAVSVFKKGFFGEDADEIIALGNDVSVLESKKIAAPSALILLKSYKDKAKNFKLNCLSLGKPSLVTMCDSILKEIEIITSNKVTALQLGGTKVPPLLFVGCGNPRTGKSVMVQGAIAALGSVYKIDNLLRREITYYPQTGSEYWEGFHEGHMHVHYDEIGSINPDIDKTAGSKFGSLLDIVSMMPTGLNMAFEKKGVTNTHNIKVVTCNTNSALPEFLANFTNPDSILGRALFVEVIPSASVRDGDRFNPLKMEKKTVENLNDNLSFSVKSYFRTNPHQKPDFTEVFSGDLVGFIRFVVAALKSGYSGPKRDVAAMFSRVSMINVDEGEVDFPDNDLGVLFAGDQLLESKFGDGLYKIRNKIFGAFTSCKKSAVSTVVNAVASDQFKNFVQFYERWRKLINGISIIIGGAVALSGVIYAIKKINNNGEKKKLDHQLLMPKALEPDESFDGETKEWMGKLFAVDTKKLDSTRMVSLFGGGVITLDGLQKIERNTLMVEIACFVEGEWQEKTINFGYPMDGFIISVGHPIHPKATKIRLKATSNIVPRGHESVELDARYFRVLDGYDCSIIYSSLPPGAKDVKKHVTFGKAKVGERCVLLGAFNRPRLEGKILFVGPIIYTYEGINYPLTEAVTTNILGTENGDCSRFLVTYPEGGGIKLVGMHYARAKDTGFAWSTALQENLIYSAASSIKGLDRQTLMCRDDISFGVMMHPEQVKLSLPSHGVFADDYFRDKQVLLPISGISDNSRGSKTSLVKSPFYDTAFSILEGCKVRYFPAPLSYQWRYDESSKLNRLVSPYAYGCDFTKSDVGIPILCSIHDCFKGVVDSIVPLMEKGVSFATLDESLHSVGIMKPVAPGTGAGMHVPGKKGSFIWEINRGEGTERIAGGELQEWTSDLLTRLIKGDIPPGVSKIALKDEALKESKIINMATRMIHVVSIDEYVVGRMLFAKVLSKIYSALQFKFGMCFSVNSLGRDWQWVYNRSVNTFGGSRTRLGADFKAYDLHHQYIYLFYAFELLCKLVFSMGDIPNSIKRAIVCYLWMKLVRITLVDGVWVYAFFGGPSGDIFTVYFNCVCQLFYWYVCWYDVRNGGTFDEFMEELGNHWCSLGDDCSLSVSVMDSKWFTAKKIIEVMKFRCGQEITGDGLKGDLEYGEHSEFLKREFLERDGFIFAPLSIRSILKMLLYYENKPNVDIEERNFQLLETVWVEAYFHDDCTRTFIRDLVQSLRPNLSLKYQNVQFRTDDIILKGFIDGNLGLWNNISRIDVDVQSSRTSNKNWDSFRELQRDACLHQLDLILCEVRRSIMLNVQERIYVSRLDRIVIDDRRFMYVKLPYRDKDNLGIWSSLGGVLRSAEKTDFGNNRDVGHPVLVVNPGELTTVGVEEGKIGTATFDTTFPTVSVEKSGPSRIGLTIGEFAENDDEFFCRPILVDTIAWSSATTDYVIDAHVEWFNNEMVFQRMQGWTNIRFDLVVRFEFSPSFYHYGLARVAWYPLYNTINAGGGGVDLISQQSVARGSQAHGVWLDASQPGPRELIIPWCHWKDALDLTDSTLGGLDQLGELVFHPAAAPLARSDNVTAGTVSIQVRAYAINIVRTGPTRVAVVLQSSKMDEKKKKPEGRIVKFRDDRKGPISETLGYTSKAFNAVTRIPYLQPFARVAAAATAGMSSTADYLGWSRDINKGHRMITRPARASGVDDYDDALALTFHNSQGLFASVNDMSNVEEDEMAISYIVGHESLVNVVNMATTDATDTLLSTMFVHPMIGWSDGTYITPSAVGWVTGAFSYWRGSIVYTFRVICSNQHSGSLRIVYDPNVGTPDPTYPFEMARVCVLEIKPGATAEITVGWSLPYAYAYKRTAFRTFAADSIATGMSNGVLRMYVYNELMAPLSTQGIKVAVSMKGGLDFRVMESGYFPIVTIDPTPPTLVGEMELQAASVTNISAVGQCHFGGDIDPGGLVAGTAFGEEVISLRAVLRRYNGMASLVASTAGTAGLTNKYYSTDFPIAETMMGGNTTWGGADNPISLDTRTPFRWFKCMYTGHRGGTRIRVRSGGGTIAGVDQGSATYRIFVNSDAAYNATSSTEGVSNSPFYASEVVDEEKREYADFKLPDYTIYRFTPGGLMNIPASTGFVRFNLGITRPVNSATTITYYIARSIDHDFSFIGFIGAPVVSQA